MSEYILLFLLFVCFILVREWAHQRERKELCDRLMAKDLTEYRKPEKREKKDPYISQHKRMIEAWRRGERDDGTQI